MPAVSNSYAGPRSDEGEGNEPIAPSALEAAMARFSHGDERAWQLVQALVTPRLQAFFTRLGCGHEQASGLTRRTIERAVLARGSFGPSAKVLPWFLAIARNCFLNCMGNGPVKGGGPENIAMNDVAGVVARCLAALTFPEREAFVLMRYEGISQRSAALIAGVSESQLRARARKAYDALCVCIRRDEAARATRARARPEIHEIYETHE